MIITKEFLTNKKACQDGIDWCEEKNLIKLKDIDFLNALIKADKLDWANWLIVRTMSYKQYVSYAVFAANQVIDIYEKKYPNDDRPRKAIEAAQLCIENPSEKNKEAAYAAARAAYAAANAAAANAVAYAAYAAANAAYAAANVAYAVDAAYAADAAANAAAKKNMKLNILNYGLELLIKKINYINEK